MLKNKFKNFHFSKEKKSLVSNFFSLSVLHGVNMVLPLITLPYLVRVLGVENFGIVNLALSIIMYFNIIISFGFELSATREISMNRDNLKKVSEIFSSVMIIKTSMLLFSLIILIVMIFLIDSLNNHAVLYLATFGVVIGNLMFPTWFFQGMERMKYITIVNTTSKVIFTILIFALIKEESDYIYVPFLNSFGGIIGGCYALWLVFKLFSIKLLVPKKEIIWAQLKDSFHFFLSRIANNGSRYFATTIIGLYFGNLTVGYYTIAEKLFYAFMALGSVVSQTIYPYMTRTRNIHFFRKVLVLITLASIVLVIPLILYNEMILEFIFNEQNEMLSKIFVIVFSGTVFGVVSAIVGYPLLAAFGYIKYANNSLIFASIIYVIYIALVIVVLPNIYLVAASIPVYMIVGLGFRLYYMHKTNLLLFKTKT